MINGTIKHRASHPRLPRDKATRFTHECSVTEWVTPGLPRMRASSSQKRDPMRRVQSVSLGYSLALNINNVKYEY